MNSAFLDYYRCPEGFAEFNLNKKLSGDRGYFRFGPDVICYGQCSGGAPARVVTDDLYDALADVIPSGSTLGLPFDPSEVIANLRYERYASNGSTMGTNASQCPFLQKSYYLVRPFLPVSLRKHLQRMRLKNWNEIRFPSWPVDGTVECIFERLLTLLLEAAPVDRIPFIWFWPSGVSSCGIVTHDVETRVGRDFCTALMDLDDAYRIKSSFQIIPEGRYHVAPSFLDAIRRRGFEINVHDLNHDGRLYHSRERFQRRAERINRFGEQYGAAGFRSGALYRNVDWYGDLNFAYDMSVPSVGHLEAQRAGCCSVMPFFIGRILELPVTTTQDYSLFHILNDYSICLWERQAAWIMQKHGLASFIVHPDYVMGARALDTYRSLLGHLADLRSEGKIWLALPGEVNDWWRSRSRMKLVRQGKEWVIEGPESDRAQVAYAVLDGDRLTYELTLNDRVGTLIS